MRSLVRVAGLAVLVFFATGCAYLRNRGNDLSDVIEFGITYSPPLKPSFAARWNAFCVLPLPGFSHADVGYLGWADRRLGVQHVKDRYWSLLLWGGERLWLGREGQDEAYDNSIYYVKRPFEQQEGYSIGLVGAFAGSRRPPGRAFGECPKMFHLGWIGFYANCSLIDLLDFVLGWTGLDIGRDDSYSS